MDVHRLKVFVSVFRQKSFSRASEELHLSQPTVSEHIKSLEEFLGVRLFDRMGRTTAPTPEAAAIFPLALEIIDKLDGIRSALASAADSPVGEVHIGASTIPGTYILPRAAADFRTKFSDVSFTLTISDSEQVARRVADNELPAGVVGARMLERGLEYSPFINDELVVVAKKSLVKNTELKAGELRDIPFLLREEGSGTRRTFEQNIKSFGVSLGGMQIVATLGSTAAVLEAVRAGLGASIISSLAVEDDLQKGRLVELRPPDGSRMSRTFYAVSKKGRTLPAAYAAFFSHLGIGSPGKS